MRKRAILAAAAAAAGALTVGGVAAAETPDPAVPVAADSPTAGTVTLPTGATVTVAPDGTLAAAGGLVASLTEDGDRIAVPLDAVGEVASGALDIAEFNVDALLRGEVPEAAEEDVSAAAVDLTVSGTWLDGKAPSGIQISWVNLETGKQSGPDFFEGPTAVDSVEPGRYHVLTMLHKDLESEDNDVIAAIDEVEVGADGTTVDVDGAAALPVGFDLDRDDAVQQGLNLDQISYEPGTLEGAWAGLMAFDDELFAVPSEGLEADRDAGFVLRQGYASPEGAAEAYGYNLFRVETDGIPADPTEVVHDDELARIDAEFQNRGVEIPMNRFDLVDHPLYDAWAWTNSGAVALPSARTEFYTADPELTWSHKGTIGYEGIGIPYDEVYRSSGALEPGSQRSASWNDSPVSVGITDTSGQLGSSALFHRDDEREGVVFGSWLFSSTAEGESVFSDFHAGSSTLSLDGQVVYEDTEDTVLSVGLDSLGDGGRVTFSAASEREAAWTPLGTASKATWAFDYDPAGNPILPVSVVAFDITGYENGVVPAGTTQEVSLEFATQPGADDQACAAMTFEVSFDDGATWTDVAVDREGDSATAQLEIPADAGFGSVRFTAADEAGATVEHETIRSFGIK